jgi:hypothetical protein
MEGTFVMVATVNELDEEALADQVLERVKADLAALHKDQFLTIDLDIPATVAAVLGVVPDVHSLREQIVKELPSFDIAQFDKLEDYALALSYAHARYLCVTQSPEDLELLSAQASELREKLVAEAKALVDAGLLSGAPLAELPGGSGYKNTATDLRVLTSLLQAAWARIEDETSMTAASLEEASRLATRLLRVAAARGKGPSRVAEAIELRLRAYTALLRAYDDARRAVTYLRSEFGDADMISPSLRPPRPRRRTTDPALQTARSAGTDSRRN